MDETIDYRTDPKETTRRLLGTALLYYIRAYKTFIYSAKDDYDEKTWKMKCREADELVELYEDAHETERLYSPLLPFDLWAGEEVIMGAAYYHQMNLAVWDDQPDTTVHRDILVLHRNILKAINYLKKRLTSLCFLPPNTRLYPLPHHVLLLPPSYIQKQLHY